MTRDDAAALDARSRIYGLLALALEYPDEALCATAGSGELGRALAAAAQALPSADAGLAERAPCTPAEDAAELGTAYSALFDHGLPTPPLAIHESRIHDRMSQMKLFEDLQRFFDFIGLERAGEHNETPDWLPLQLEAMHYLTYREAQADEDGEGRKLRALQSDLFRRHIAHWVRPFARGLARHSSTDFYRELGAYLERFAELEAETLGLSAPR